MIVSLCILPVFVGGEWWEHHLKWGMKAANRKGIPVLLKIDAYFPVFPEQRGVDPADFDCDHIIPVKSGGPTCLDSFETV